MSQHLSVTLSDDQRAFLTHLTRGGNAPARVQTRARILLLSNRGQGERRTQGQVAEALGICSVTVGAICRRFVREGVESALVESPRPGKTPKITGAVEAQLCLLACSDPPKGYARWTMQMLADKLIELELVESITDSTVCERLKKTRLSPGKSLASASASPRPST